MKEIIDKLDELPCEMIIKILLYMDIEYIILVCGIPKINNKINQDIYLWTDIYTNIFRDTEINAIFNVVKREWIKCCYYLNKLNPCLISINKDLKRNVRYFLYTFSQYFDAFENKQGVLCVFKTDLSKRINLLYSKNEMHNISLSDLIIPIVSQYEGSGLFIGLVLLITDYSKKIYPDLINNYENKHTDSFKMDIYDIIMDLISEDIYDTFDCYNIKSSKDILLKTTEYAFNYIYNYNTMPNCEQCCNYANNLL